MSMTRMIVAAFGVASSAMVLAQEEQAARFPSTPAMSEVTYAAELAKELRRAAILELRAPETPAGEDYLLTGFILDVASQCGPESAEDLRLRVEAAFNAGDAAALDAAGRKLLKIDPSDTRTQLRLISSKIASIQTIEGRLAAIDRLTGAEGAKIDASVRSRLALDAALMAKERGDTAGYVARLKLAAQLDGTHKEAALLAYEHFVSVNDDPVGAAELLVNLLYADPLDAAVHALLRDALLSVRAIPEAQRFQNSRLNILKRLNFTADERDTAEELLFTWLVKGSASTVADLERQLRSVRDEESRRLALMDPAMRAQEKKPEDNRLSLVFEEMRLLAAIAANNRGSVDASLTDLAASAGELVSEMSKQIESGSGTQELSTQIVRTSQRAQLLRLIAGAGLDRVAADLATFEALKEVTAPDIAIVKAWQAFRADDLAKAEQELAKTDPDDFGALLAAEIAAKKGDSSKAIALLNDVYKGSALTSLGVYCYSRMIALDPKQEKPDASAKRVATIAMSVPQWIDSMAMDSRLHQVLQVKPRKETILATEQAVFDVTLKNVSRIPLALGSASPLNSRLMFGPTLETAVGPLYTAEPEVTDIGGRFRLMPGEQISVTVEPERGVTGYLANVWSRSPVRLRWRVIQGYEPGRGQSRVPGPGCADLITDTIVKQGLGEALLSDEDLARAIASAPESRLQSLLYAARASLSGLTATELSTPNPSAVAGSIASRYPALTPAGRAMVLCVMPPTAKVESLAVLDAALLEESDPSLMTLGLILRVAKSDHELIRKCEASERADVKAIARVVRARLDAGRTVYADTGVAAPLFNPEQQP
jgi:hypothetical protein